VSTILNGDLVFHLPLLVSLHYLGKHEPRNLFFSVMLISAYGCMDFSSYFQAGLESRSVDCVGTIHIYDFGLHE